MDALAQQPRPLGADAQKPLRRLEGQARTRALALCRWGGLHDIPTGDVADRIGIARQTLDNWAGLRRLGRLHCSLRGRPTCRLETGLGDQVHELLQECRGRLGLPALKHLFPEAPRTTLKHLRDQFLDDHDPWLEHLIWTRPGTVWSADFTQPPTPVDRLYPFILAIRDLASSCQLLAWPVPHPDARFTLRGLRHLFALHGPPLVLKTDNGSHFTALDVRQLLDQHKIAHLLSPPLTPRYNGGQEAAIGSLKTRAIHIAAAAGRFDCWTCDDVENARLEANRQARPCGFNGPVPDELWETRCLISSQQRADFLLAVAFASTDEQRKLIQSIQPEPGCRPALALNATQRATVARRAIRRALVELGYLLARRTMN